MNAPLSTTRTGSVADVRAALAEGARAVERAADRAANAVPDADRMDRFIGRACAVLLILALIGALVAQATGWSDEPGVTPTSTKSSALPQHQQPFPHRPLGVHLA